MTANPALSAERRPMDQVAALRPKSLAEFIGQQAARRLELGRKGFMIDPWAI